MARETRETSDSAETISTTIGDLICAISDAAKEAKIAEEDLAVITQLVLNNVINKNSN